jgi:4-amino-4-deoxy-L-arabinose transferase-like glycosyltransferase
MVSVPQAITQDSTTANSTRALVWLLVVAAVVRLLLWGWFHGLPIRIVDEKDYNGIALNLVRHGEYALEPGIPTSLRPPLYPALVAGIYILCGEENFQAVRLVQVILSLITLLLLYGLGIEIASRQLGLWLAGLYAFYPTLLGFNNLLLTEVMFTLLLTAACYTLVRAYHRDQVSWLAGTGLLLGLGALTRSILWLFPVVLAPWLLLTWKGSFARRLAAIAILIVPFVAPIAPWAHRCSRLEKTFIPIDVMSGRNLMLGNYQYTPLYRSWDAIALKGEKEWIAEVLATSTLEERGTQGRLDKLAMKRGLKFMRENPGLTFQRDVVKFFDFWGLERELVAGAGAGFFGSIPRVAIVILAGLITVSYLLVLFLGIFGLFLAPPEDWRIHGFFVLLMAFICGIHTLVFAHSRYHLPLIPILLVYTARAIIERRAIWARRKSLSFWLAVGVCLGFVAGWSWLFVAVDLPLLEKMLS